MNLLFPKGSRDLILKAKQSKGHEGSKYRLQSRGARCQEDPLADRIDTNRTVPAEPEARTRGRAGRGRAYTTPRGTRLRALFPHGTWRPRSAMRPPRPLKTLKPSPLLHPSTWSRARSCPSPAASRSLLSPALSRPASVVARRHVVQQDRVHHRGDHKPQGTCVPWRAGRLARDLIQVLSLHETSLILWSDVYACWFFFSSSKVKTINYELRGEIARHAEVNQCCLSFFLPVLTGPPLFTNQASI